MSDNQQHWVLDKRVPIALIMTLTFQTFGAIWWAASTDGRVSTLEKQVYSMAGQDRRLTRVETQMENILKSLERIEKKLNQAK